MEPMSITTAMSPMSLAASARRACADSPFVDVLTRRVSDALTTVAANSAATNVPTNAGRWPRRAEWASPVLMRQA